LRTSDERCGFGIVACCSQKIDRIGADQGERNVVRSRDEGRAFFMGCYSQVEVMNAPVVEQFVALVEFPDEGAAPRTQRCPALDRADERLIPGHMSRWHREITGLNDTPRLGRRDAA
jgi:hypothetical protein